MIRKAIAKLVERQDLSEGEMIEVMDQDYIRTARSKGLRSQAVVARHVVRNALLPIVTILGFELAALISGSIFVATFCAPGSVANRNCPIAASSASKIPALPTVITALRFCPL